MTIQPGYKGTVFVKRTTGSTWLPLPENTADFSLSTNIEDTSNASDTDRTYTTHSPQMKSATQNIEMLAVSGDAAFELIRTVSFGSSEALDFKTVSNDDGGVETGLQFEAFCAEFTLPIKVDGAQRSTVQITVTGAVILLPVS